MKYSYKSIKSITKFSVLDLGVYYKETSNQIKLSGIFWEKMLSYEYFSSFVENKYKPFKQQKETPEKYTFFLQEYDFLLQKLEQARLGIDIKKKSEIPS
jgi:hypothetical protein